MKKLFVLILLLFTVTLSYSQTKQLEELDENYYKFTSYNDLGKVSQSGYYKKVDDFLIADGIWYNEFGTKAFYSNGELKWIKVKNGEKVTNTQIKIHRLERKVSELQGLLASNK